MLITAVELSNETYIFLPLPSQITFCPGWLEPGATPPTANLGRPLSPLKLRPPSIAAQGLIAAPEFAAAGLFTPPLVQVGGASFSPLL